LNPAEFEDWTSYYREYQSRLAVEYLLPVLRDWGRWRDGVRILDVGAGDGGAALALVEAGAQLEGIELEPRRLESAREEAGRRGLSIRLGVADITRPETLSEFSGPYDLILFRDVLEHIPARAAALRCSRERLGDGGAIMVVFPPYLSPFGGHQQILHPPRRLGIPWARLPWIHCLPQERFRALARARDGSDDPEWEEIERIAEARLTLGALRRSSRDAGLRLERSQEYLLRPSFRLRYGTPVLKAGPLAWIPGLRELAVSASYQLLVPDQRM
jgi:SAM-dependent methyltransferase